MRRAARIDRNQPEVINALRAIGASVQPLHTAHDGIPDLLVGYQGKNYLIEIKDGAKVPSKRKLTDRQIEWHGQWSGQAAVVNSVDEAIAVVQSEVTA